MLKKAAYKAADETGELIGNKISEEIVNTKHVLDENSRYVEEIATPSEQKEKY